ncbi:MAG: hypothetical protein FJ026_01890 [Chloroflexi bacterium]|nr:hypothetical protein [Chloroflexota bacterium]
MANTSPCLSVNTQQCAQLAACLSALQVHPDPYLQRPKTEHHRRQEANYWFYVTAMCQSTRTFEGYIGGHWVRGWDYLVEATRRRMRDFRAERMASYTADELRGLLSDGLDPRDSSIDRVEERLGQLHDCATRLLQHYDGEAMGIYERSAGRLAGQDGLLDLLAGFVAYADPMQKKSVLLAGMLHEVGIWPLQDADNLRVAMDYHAMRVALRSGMVEVADEELATDLRQQRPISAEVNQAVRSAVSSACDVIVRSTGLSVFAFDKFIWHLGRSCCFYEHDPVCGPGRVSEACPVRDKCSFLRATNYACPNVCIFDGVCKGSRSPAYRAYWETNIYTPDY